MLVTWTILLAGVCASAVSFIFIRESTEPPVMLAAFRVLLAGIVLLPVYLHARKTYTDAPLPVVIKRSLLPGGVLGLHFIAWVIGARMTPAANASLIVNVMPVVMPFFMFFMFREQIKPRELMATGITVIGMLLLGYSDFSISRTHFIGDIVCLVSMILFAWYLAIARHHRALPTVWLYIVPVYLSAGVLTFIVALFFSSPIHHYTPYNLAMIAGVALVSTVIGHSALNYAMQRIRGQTVTVVNMLQFVIGGIFGYLIYAEIPTAAFYIASVLVVLSIILVLKGAGIDQN